jgi:hypothetical protein
MLIRLPMPSDGGRSISSLEVRDPPERRKKRYQKRRIAKSAKNARVSMRERLKNRRKASY